uniref:Very long-chain fatty acid transport protein n=1 Tax=Arcella intermedia TaxID=1963864 RepID=A0A6B2L0X2_9EUKA
MTFIDDQDKVTPYTFQQVDKITNQVANALKADGMKYGDCIALMMDNKPEFVFSWLGVAKAGGITALINTNLSSKSLLHSFVTSKATRFIIGSEHLKVVDDLRQEIKNSDNPETQIVSNGKYYIEGTNAPGYLSFDSFIEKQPPHLIGGFPPERNGSHPLLYIYTSGTTGLPKASIITNLRLAMPGIAFTNTYRIQPTDIYYCSLPFYHSSATLICLSASWYSGAKLVFRRKFSASKFWKDCIKCNCTVAQYIGELCHYLLERPPAQEDKAHGVRMMIGNGMRSNIWEKFKERFNVKQIGEFYAATEGPAAIFNGMDKTGAIGYVPKILMRILDGVPLIKYDVENDEILKDEKGFCIRCKPGEVGQFVTVIDPLKGSEFRGYTNKEATEKKILRDVFKKGDMWYLSGDLLKMDKDGFFYFVDRIGDTFRWKGENVSTGEVELTISDFPGINEVNVYGVRMPNTSGRAGMASIVVEDLSLFDFKKFYDYTNEKLPSYAVPLFLRFPKSIEVTGTLKHLKAAKREEGFNPDIVKDPMYFIDKDAKTYIPLTKETYLSITQKKAKL